jgi:hypothetical protein
MGRQRGDCAMRDYPPPGGEPLRTVPKTHCIFPRRMPERKCH